MPLAPYRCLSGKCKNNLSPDYAYTRVQYLNEGDSCADCKTNHALVALTVIHLLVPDPEGPFKASPDAVDEHGECVTAWSIKCDREKKKAVGLSSEVSAVTCPACLGIV